MITYEELQKWIDELKKECDGSKWQEPYKMGYIQGLIAIEIKMDDAKKRLKHETQN